MALTTYAGLLAALPVWAFRPGDTEFIAQCPDFVSLAHEYLQANLRARDMEDLATATPVSGAVALPDDYLEWRSVRTATSPQTPLTHVSPDYAVDTYGISAAGVAEVFTIVGDTLTTYPASTADIYLDYYKAIPVLSDDNQSNWLLEKSQAAYLYGALLQAAPYMMDDARATTWGTFLEKALDDIRRQDRMSRYARVSTRVRGATP